MLYSLITTNIVKMRTEEHRKLHHNSLITTNIVKNRTEKHRRLHHNSVITTIIVKNRTEKHRKLYHNSVITTNIVIFFYCLKMSGATAKDGKECQMLKRVFDKA